MPCVREGEERMSSQWLIRQVLVTEASRGMRPTSSGPVSARSGPTSGVYCPSRRVQRWTSFMSTVHTWGVAETVQPATEKFTDSCVLNTLYYRVPWMPNLGCLDFAVDSHFLM